MINPDRDAPVAFVLGLFETGLAAVRSLARAGIPVVGLEADPSQPGFKSRYCRARRCPDPMEQPEALLEFLVAEGKTLGSQGILFPASDAYVLFVSRHRDQLQPYFRFMLPPPEVVEAILNKRGQYELAERFGIPYPPTFYPESPADLEPIQHQLQYPVFIKPYYSHLWREKFPGTKGFVARSPQELLDRFAEVKRAQLQAMVQSIVPGPTPNQLELSVYLDSAGQLLACFSIRKIRQYPPEFGVGTLVESGFYPELLEVSLPFLRAIGFCGIGNIEFKRDAGDGQLKLIELNARLWEQNAQAAQCGLNYPLIQYLDLLGQPPAPQTQFPVGVKWVDPLADFMAFWYEYRQGRLSPWAWLASWRKAQTFAPFAWDDPLPGLRSIGYGKKLLRLSSYLRQVADER